MVARASELVPAGPYGRTRMVREIRVDAVGVRRRVSTQEGQSSVKAAIRDGL